MQDTDLETYKIKAPTFTFHDENNKLVGTLHCGDPMRFEGNADKSARIFFDELIKLMVEAPQGGDFHADRKRAV